MKIGDIVTARQKHPANGVFQVFKINRSGWLHCWVKVDERIYRDSVFKFRTSEMEAV